MRPTDPAHPALSPCPFCGGPAHIMGGFSELGYPTEPPEERWIECQECEANTAGYATKAAAVAAWNRRVVVADQPEKETV